MKKNEKTRKVIKIFVGKKEEELVKGYITLRPTIFT